jgi:hypothetical protein
MNNYTLSASHIGTMSVDYLTNHHRGENELLIGCSMSQAPDLSVARGETIYALLCELSGYGPATLPFTAVELENAIATCVEGLGEWNMISPACDENDQDECDDRLIWVVLSWFHDEEKFTDSIRYDEFSASKYSARITWEQTLPDDEETGFVSAAINGGRDLMGFCSMNCRLVTQDNTGLYEVDIIDEREINLLNSFEGDLNGVINRAKDFGITYQDGYFQSLSADQCYATGAEIYYAMHLDGFDEDQLKAIQTIVNE